MIHHTKFLFAVLKISLVREFQDRSALVAGVLITIFWQLSTIILAVGLLGRFGNIGGWNRDEIMVLVSTWGMINGFVHVFFHASLISLPGKISTGKFDMLLLKPVNSVIISAVNYFYPNNLLNALTYLGMVIYFSHDTVGFFGYLGFAVFSIMGVLMQFFLWLAVVALAFYTERLDGTFDLFAVFRAAGKYPAKAYSGIKLLLLLTIMPFILMAQVPASFLVGKVEIRDIVYFVVTFVLVVFCCLSFWRYSIKQYSSASS